ncbi:ras-related protein Rab-37-like isoform X2 [Venturia canescens]|uniref:ras-related protein Rab-37-like isoform X2 n=1 Tax=Venturia canescens TaxID=32260 RepID=UPI001C9CF90F|nr:ras-related protein Rab-37-like isoform X2 [Venturia canescens]XP_043272195.1 ras-related protein Rab-37-like isoform X2 [Venturia canescens]XP_043272196.1 ras-related protein Rab-37-like isoform X2 [Venturia canescens]
MSVMEEEPVAATSAAAGGVSGNDEIRSGLFFPRKNHADESNFDGSTTSTASTIRSYWKTQASFSDSSTHRQTSQDQLISASQRTLQSSNSACDYFFKVMLLGDSGVGKTCLLTRFRDGRFLSGNYITTVGIDFRNKMIEVDEAKVKLQIWDTAGQERFRSVTHAYYRDAHALLLLYDVTNKTSYDNIRAWLGEIREYAHDDVVIMLLGNKCDCGNERIVKREDGERLAREHNVPFMETSAKTGLNVELAFVAVARYLKARKSGNPDTSKFNVQDYVRQQSQKKTCFNYNCSTT